MAKVTVTITDKPEGGVAVVFNPTIGEMKKQPDKWTAAHIYAAAVANAVLELSKKMVDDPEYREKHGLFIPKGMGKR